MNTLIAIDWGTTSLRAALLDANGAVIEQRSEALGILSIPPGGFPQAFRDITASWTQQENTLALMCGMVGSRQGWSEAPYSPCPAGFEDIAQRLHWTDPGRTAIVPGLSCEHHGVPDVMRGEETQVFGACELLGVRDATFVLPGTHSKWVRVVQGRIESFRTFMTGEVYALLRRNSILARTMPEAEGDLDEPAFLQGVAQSRRSGNLLQAAFSARTLALFDRLPRESAPSYLSGLVLGEELRTAAASPGGRVCIIGAPALRQRYALALQAMGIRCESVGDEAAWRGLHAIARTIAAKA